MKPTYSELLLDPRWQAKRILILNRDEYLCQGCFTNKRLQVHHKYYTKDTLPWDYPDEALTTLCDDCHGIEHEKPKIICDYSIGLPEHISVVLDRVM